MIGVAYLDMDGDARAFIKEFGVAYPTGPDNGSTISGAYGVKGVPETYLVDKAGYLVKVIIAPINADDLRPLLDRLLAENPTGAE
jgi:cytochrome c biogenesis protein CcmG/thiol:disulfide interchange protein DsbE